jgi:hypothetical protein
MFLALGCGLVLLLDPSERPVMYIVILDLAFLVATFQFFSLRRKTRLWNERMSRRLPGLAPSAGKVGFDKIGLGVGDRVLPWDALAIQQADFIRHSITAARGGPPRCTSSSVCRSPRRRARRARHGDDGKRTADRRQCLAPACRRADGDAGLTEARMAEPLVVITGASSGMPTPSPRTATPCS